MKRLITLLNKHNIEWRFFRNGFRSLYHGQDFMVWDEIVINNMFELRNTINGWEFVSYEVQDYSKKDTPTCIMLQAFVLGLMKLVKETN